MLRFMPTAISDTWSFGSETLCTSDLCWLRGLCWTNISLCEVALKGLSETDMMATHFWCVCVCVSVCARARMHSRRVSVSVYKGAHTRAVSGHTVEEDRQSEPLVMSYRTRVNIAAVRPLNRPRSPVSTCWAVTNTASFFSKLMNCIRKPLSPPFWLAGKSVEGKAGGHEGW